MFFRTKHHDIINLTDRTKIITTDLYAFKRVFITRTIINIELTVICGTNKQTAEKLRRRHGENPRVHIRGYVKDMSLMLDSADLYLTKAGGISTTEAAIKGVPLVLLGHSMGSFLARAYTARYPETIDGAIFVGTAGTNNPTRAAQLFAGALGKPRGGHFRSKQLYNLSFKGYNSRYPNEGAFAWLSRDAAAGKRFANDPQRNFIFTANGYYALFSVLAAVSKPAWAEHYPKDMPTLFLAGDMDPVGNYVVQHVLCVPEEWVCLLLSSAGRRARLATSTRASSVAC